MTNLGTPLPWPTGDWTPPIRRWTVEGTRLDGSAFSTYSILPLSLGDLLLRLAVTVNAHELVHLTIKEIDE